jgi:hypothetical protein
MITRRSVRRALGLAALLAAARVAWWHHTDNQLVIRTDLVRDAFAAGQAAERNRRAEEERTARAWTPSPPPNWLADVYRGRIGLTFGPEVEPERDYFTEPGAGRLGPADLGASIDGAPVVGVRLGEGGTVEWVTERNGQLDEFADPEEPEGSGWIEWGDPGQGTRG